MMGNFFTSNRPKVSLGWIPPSLGQWKSVQQLVGKRLSEGTLQLLHERGYRMEISQEGALAAVRHVSVDSRGKVIIFDSASRDYSHLEARLGAVNGEAPLVELTVELLPL